MKVIPKLASGFRWLSTDEATAHLYRVEWGAVCGHSEGLTTRVPRAGDRLCGPCANPTVDRCRRCGRVVGTRIDGTARGHGGGWLGPTCPGAGRPAWRVQCLEPAEAAT